LVFGSTRRWVVVAAAITVLAMPVPAPACECDVFVDDAHFVQRVQSSWTSGYASTRAGNYAEALRELRSTAKFIPFIRDRKARECVAAGAQNLIGSAAAGNNYLSLHPRDPDGAKAAAQRAWRTFVDCS
jgi:hypothetical protein